jgi:DNA-binding FadR family transcriptional regulator
VNADLDGSGEVSLSQPDEAPERRNVLARFETAFHQTLAESSGDGSLRLFFGQFGDVGHR